MVLVLLCLCQIIERILEFSRHQITDVMSAYDPIYRALHKPIESGVLEGWHSHISKKAKLLCSLSSYILFTFQCFRLYDNVYWFMFLCFYVFFLSVFVVSF